jgi:hypothetical protein
MITICPEAAAGNRYRIKLLFWLHFWYFKCVTILTRSPKWVLVVAILACPSLASANIGDDLAQLRARYGSASEMGQLLFVVKVVDGKIVPAKDSTNAPDHFSVTVYLDKDHSAMEVITRNTSDPDKSDMSQDDINTFLAAASEGQTWQPIPLPNGKPTWVRSDHKLIARFATDTGGHPDDASVLVIALNRQ